MNDCCKLVGNLNISKDLGLISVQSQGSTDVNLITSGSSSTSVVSASTGTVSLTAYASNERYIGCPGRAGVSVTWINKSDCGKQIYLFGGSGKSYISGGAASYVYFPEIEGLNNPINVYKVLNASASSGPSSLYEAGDQQDGYGLVYEGNPWNIDTSTEEGCTVNLTSYGIGEDYGECKLQNLNIQFVPGQVPVVNMSLLYTIN